MTLPFRPAVAGLSGERFQVRYQLTGTEAEARSLAETACVEQSVEFPAELIPDGDIRDQVTGRLEAFEPAGSGCYFASISFPVESAAGELTQLLNLIWGTGSFFGGFRADRVALPPGLLAQFRGPRFGAEGIRELLGVYGRPLLCTAIKPIGLSAADLADLTYRCALGGIDIVKDDHSLTDQPYAPFNERVDRCAEAMARANRETGKRCVYAPNITAPAHLIAGRARYARDAGAGALLISPAITGLDAMRAIADDDAIALPVLSHPAFCGHFVVHPDHGFSHYLYYGQLQRLAGADASIYVNAGGRFQVRPEDSLEAAAGCAADMGPIRKSLPLPGGGMTRERIPQLIEAYGHEVIFLVGGGLHRQGPDLVANARDLLQAVEASA
jgi:ribulose-bisphosphate carboxylase large chain